MHQIIISALILCTVIFLIARHEAEISLPVILMITVGVSFVGALLGVILSPLVGLVVSLGLLTWALYRFCYLPWPKAGIVTVIYLITNIGLSVGMKALSKA
jgi:hypothetical protein